jgi:hypothetical protein
LTPLTVSRKLPNSAQIELGDATTIEIRRL